MALLRAQFTPAPGLSDSCDALEYPFMQVVLEQNIKGEQCAIRVYDKRMKLMKDADPVTCNIIALQIIEEEVEHEEDL